MRLIESIAPFYFVLILTEILYTYKYKLTFYSFRDSVADLSLGTLSRIADGVILLGIVFVYQSLQNLFSFEDFLPLSLVSYKSPYSWVILFILVDFLFYWAHRFAHEINLFWASHVVHHSSEEFNLSVALRQSFVRNLFIGIFYLPLAVFGFSAEAYLITDALNRTYQFWVHTRIIDKLPFWYELIFVTPSHHRVHHAVNPRYIDKNYGGVFIFWDRWFGTFEEEKEEPVYGVVKPLGTFQPILAEIHVFSDLFRDFRLTKNKREGILGFFKPPGFRPSDLPAYPKPRPVSPYSFTKFYPKGKETNGFRFYIISQFVITALSSLVFIKTYGKWTYFEISVFTYVIVFSFYSLGKVLNSQTDVKRYELAKWLFWILIAGYFAL
ncbi:sterol desaturase family protein [Leptospira ilyithenensis]|uniref:Sterol desaturase family protein n=1 Tax=Leptospira ilyithenensis TaxID=2484901 RepID=A0A4R9LLK4_9LEPT|nr:sterol desaturase family protein [Leptospira ilyithenensis]TGN07034.1 sterol desaturase family protein [Leptospira ilyithenensis]